MIYKFQIKGSKLFIESTFAKDTGELAKPYQIDWQTARHAREYLELMLMNEFDEEGRPKNLNTMISGTLKDCSAQVHEGTAYGLELFFRLAKGVKEPARIEYLAKRIERMTREERGYWLCKMSIGSGKSTQWAEAGLRMMLCGTSRDADECARLLYIT